MLSQSRVRWLCSALCQKFSAVFTQDIIDVIVVTLNHLIHGQNIQLMMFHGFHQTSVMHASLNVATTFFSLLLNRKDKCINRGKGDRHATETAQLGIAKVLSFFQHPQCGPCISGWASAERQPTYLWSHILPMKGSFEHGHRPSPIPHVLYQAPCSADWRRAPFKMCSHAIFCSQEHFLNINIFQSIHS